MKGALKDITEEEFQRSFQGWKVRLKKCVASGGNYFDRYSVEIEGF